MLLIGKGSSDRVFCIVDVNNNQLEMVMNDNINPFDKRTKTINSQFLGFDKNGPDLEKGEDIFHNGKNDEKNGTINNMQNITRCIKENNSITIGVKAELQYIRISRELIEDEKIKMGSNVHTKMDKKEQN